MTKLAVFTRYESDTVDYTTFYSAGTLTGKENADPPAMKQETSTGMEEKWQQYNLGVELKVGDTQTSNLLSALYNCYKIIRQYDLALQKLRNVEIINQKHKIECYNQSFMLSSIQTYLFGSISRLGLLADHNYVACILDDYEVVLALQVLANELNAVTIRLQQLVADMRTKESELQEEISRTAKLAEKTNQEMYQLRDSEEDREAIIQQLERRIKLSEEALKASGAHRSNREQEDTGVEEAEEVVRMMKEKLYLRDDCIHRQESTISSLQTQIAEERVKCSRLYDRVNYLSGSELQCKDQLAERLVLRYRVNELYNETEVLYKALSVTDCRYQHEIGYQRDQFIKELADVEEAVENDLLRLQYQLSHAVYRIKELENSNGTLQAQVNKNSSYMRLLLAKMRTIIQERVNAQIYANLVQYRIFAAEEQNTQLRCLIDRSQRELEELKDKFQAIHGQ